MLLGRHRTRAPGASSPAWGAAWEGKFSQLGMYQGKVVGKGGGGGQGFQVEGTLKKPCTKVWLA